MKASVKMVTLIVAGACVVLLAFSFWAASPRPQFYYCFDQGSIWVRSSPTLFARHGYYSDGPILKKTDSDLPWIWNGLRGGVQISVPIPRSADPLTWKPSLETVMRELERAEANHGIILTGYRRETYATNFVSVKERYEH
jgi:hypothetical protein